MSRLYSHPCKYRKKSWRSIYVLVSCQGGTGRELLGVSVVFRCFLSTVLHCYLFIIYLFFSVFCWFAAFFAFSCACHEWSVYHWLKRPPIVLQNVLAATPCCSVSTRRSLSKAEKSPGPSLGIGLEASEKPDVAKMICPQIGGLTSLPYSAYCQIRWYSTDLVHVSHIWACLQAGNQIQRTTVVWKLGFFVCLFFLRCFLWNVLPPSMFTLCLDVRFCEDVC